MVKDKNIKISFRQVCDLERLIKHQIGKVHRLSNLGDLDKLLVYLKMLNRNILKKAEISKNLLRK